jgi:hypothetical protein
VGSTFNHRQNTVKFCLTQQICLQPASSLVVAPVVVEAFFARIVLLPIYDRRHLDVGGGIRAANTSVQRS